MPTSFVYFLFFLSGVAGLIYEIVWGRQLVLIFGSTTNSIVAVIAAFLGGLAIGSLIFGKIADRLTPKKLIKTYSILELGVAITAILSLILIPFIRNIYGIFSDGSQVTTSVLIIKFIASILIIFAPTILMGATLPILVKFLESQKTSLTLSVSMLYAVNTFGAVIGVLVSAFILIELFGLRNTLLIAALINFLVAFAARFLKYKDIKVSSKVQSGTSFAKLLNARNVTVLLAFSLSGLIAIAYEVLWTRILTPSVGTFIYAFAVILAIYLFGIAAGSLIFQKFSKLVKKEYLTFAFCQLAIGFFVLASVYLTSNQITLGRNILVILVILPATIFMGLTFPAVVAIIKSEQSGRIVGLSYFANTIGSILGAFLVSFFFLPKIGSSQSLILLSIANFLIALYFISREKASLIKYLSIVVCLFFVICTSWLFVFRRESLYQSLVQWRINWAKMNNIDFKFTEDEVASSFGYHNRANDDVNLFIDGVPTTSKVGETKLMAHIPILLHKNPKNMLVVAFGMGSTFRSSLSHDINTDVVELVPSVPKMFPLFQNDAEEVLANPKGKIIINDGRNYIFLTQKKYDVVTIDPPPPFNAAGTTVLYSKNFYEDIAKKLEKGGIVSQWMLFGSQEDDVAMAIESFVEVFPYIKVFKVPGSFEGIFLEGSFEPIEVENSRFKQQQNSKAEKDLEEFYKDGLKISDIPKLLIGDRESLLSGVSTYPSITDDRPSTEYFILRHKFKGTKDLNDDKFGEDFVSKISTK